MRIVEVKMSKAGWPPSLIQAIVSGTSRISIHGLKALDISDGAPHPYSWKLTGSQTAFLESLVRIEAKT